MLLPDSVYDLSGSVKAVYVENHADECVDLDDEEVRTEQASMSLLQESDFLTEESRGKFIRESFKIDENEILNRDKTLKEEVIKLFLENFSTLA